MYHTLTRYQQLNNLLTHRLLLQNIFLWTVFKKSNHAINLPAQFIRIFATFEICCQQTNGQTRSPTLPCWWRFAGRGSFVVRCWMRYQTDVVWWTRPIIPSNGSPSGKHRKLRVRVSLYPRVGSGRVAIFGTGRVQKRNYQRNYISIRFSFFCELTITKEG